MTDRKKPGVVFWATVVLVAVLILYPISFGPACWISSRAQPSGQIVSVVYYPVIRLWTGLPESQRRAVGAYIVLGVPPLTTVSTDGNGIKFF